jgi:hypothetical protein
MHDKTEFNTSQDIEVITLNEFCRNKKINPDVLKLDIEGYEFHALVGASEILSHLKIIQFEFGGTCIDSRVFFRDIWDLLTKANFHVARIADRGLILISHYSEEHEIFQYSNYIAFRKEFIQNFS